MNIRIPIAPGLWWICRTRIFVKKTRCSPPNYGPKTAGFNERPTSRPVGYEFFFYSFTCAPCRGPLGEPRASVNPRPRRRSVGRKRFSSVSPAPGLLFARKRQRRSRRRRQCKRRHGRHRISIQWQKNNDGGGGGGIIVRYYYGRGYCFIGTAPNWHNRTFFFFVTSEPTSIGARHAGINHPSAFFSIIFFFCVFPVYPRTFQRSSAHKGREPDLFIGTYLEVDTAEDDDDDIHGDRSHEPFVTGHRAIDIWLAARRPSGPKFFFKAPTTENDMIVIGRRRHVHERRGTRWHVDGGLQEEVLKEFS